MYVPVAKVANHSGSDIDLVAISDSLTYREVFRALERAVKTVGRRISPPVCTVNKFSKRLGSGTLSLRVMEQLKFWIFESEHGIPVAARALGEEETRGARKVRGCFN